VAGSMNVYCEPTHRVDATYAATEATIRRLRTRSSVISDVSDLKTS
jgi:hypothetical protein